MNILYIGFDIEGVGGIATYSRHQIQALRDLGYRLFILSLDKTDVRIATGFADRHVAFGDKYRAGLNFLRLLGEKKERSFDAVVINHVYLGIFGWIARLVTGAPYVINVYNIDILTRLPALREFAFGRADLAIADCRYTIDRVPNYRHRVPPLGLLYDPVDTSFFRPIDRTEARRELERRFGPSGLGGRTIVTTVSSFLEPPNKGHRQTIDALARLKDPRFLYVMVGDGPDRPKVEAYARAAGVADQVKFLGRVDQDALPYLYSAADVAVLVARGGPGLGEAVPLGLIEASACAVPFICGNQDGSVEAIDPAHPNGFAIDPTDIDALAVKLKLFADDPAKGVAMGLNGKRLVDAQFAYPKFVETQGELLAGLLGQPSRARTTVSGSGPARTTVPNSADHTA